MNNFSHLDPEALGRIKSALDTFQNQFQNKVDICFFLHKGELSTYLPITLHSYENTTFDEFQWNDEATVDDNFSQLEQKLAANSSIYWAIDQNALDSQLINIHTWKERLNRRLMQTKNDQDNFNPTIYISVTVADPTSLPIGDLQQTGRYTYNYKLEY